MLPDSAFLMPILGHHFVYAQQIYTFDYASPALIYSWCFISMYVFLWKDTHSLIDQEFANRFVNLCKQPDTHRKMASPETMVWPCS